MRQFRSDQICLIRLYSPHILSLQQPLENLDRDDKKGLHIF